jgi:hypothetical protein
MNLPEGKNPIGRWVFLPKLFEFLQEEDPTEDRGIVSELTITDNLLGGS